MRTKLDPDDEFFIPDVSELDWSTAIVGRRARKPGEKTEIFIIATIEAGRSPRTLALDAIFGRLLDTVIPPVLPSVVP